MKKLSTHDIFSIFDLDDDQTQTRRTKDTDECFVALSTLISGVENYYLLDHMYLNRYGQSYIDVRQSLQVKYLSKLLKYVDRYDDIPLNTVHGIVDKFGEGSISFALNDMLECFLQVEDYQKCATLDKLMKIFNVKNLH